jgi:hypothetical protein
LLNKQLLPGSRGDERSRNMNTVCFITVEVYENGALSYSFRKDHPLYQRLEFVNDTGQLETRTVEQDTADFRLRIPLKNGATDIEISETVFGKTNLLYNIKNIEQ